MCYVYHGVYRRAHWQCPLKNHLLALSQMWTPFGCSTSIASIRQTHSSHSYLLSHSQPTPCFYHHLTFKHLHLHKQGGSRTPHKYQRSVAWTTSCNFCSKVGPAFKEDIEFLVPTWVFSFCSAPQKPLCRLRPITWLPASGAHLHATTGNVLHLQSGFRRVPLGVVHGCEASLNSLCTKEISALWKRLKVRFVPLPAYETLLCVPRIPNGELYSTNKAQPTSSVGPCKGHFCCSANVRVCQPNCIEQSQTPNPPWTLCEANLCKVD